MTSLIEELAEEQSNDQEYKRVSDYDFRHKEYKIALNDFVTDKVNMSQNEKWEAFYKLCTDYSDITNVHNGISLDSHLYNKDVRKVIDSINKIIRKRNKE
jgi:hypothetical protein